MTVRAWQAYRRRIFLRRYFYAARRAPRKMGKPALPQSSPPRAAYKKDARSSPAAPYGSPAACGRIAAGEASQLACGSIGIRIPRSVREQKTSPAVCRGAFAVKIPLSLLYNKERGSYPRRRVMQKLWARIWALQRGVRGGEEVQISGPKRHRSAAARPHSSPRMRRGGSQFAEDAQGGLTVRRGCAGRAHSSPRMRRAGSQLAEDAQGDGAAGEPLVHRRLFDVAVRLALGHAPPFDERDLRARDEPLAV